MSEGHKMNKDIIEDAKAAGFKLGLTNVFVFQDFNLLDTFSVQDNIFLPATNAIKNR